MPDDLSGLPLISSPWLFADHGHLLFSLFSSKMCPILIVLSLKSVKFLEMFQHDAGALHLCKCLILLSLSLMKSHKPLRSPSPPNYLSSSRHLWAAERGAMGLTGPRLSQERWGVSGQPQVLHLPSDLFINLTATSWDYINDPEASEHCLPSTLLFSFSFIFSQRLCHALLWWGSRSRFFLRQGLKFFLQQQGVVILYNYENLFVKTKKTPTHTSHIHSILAVG